MQYEVNLTLKAAKALADADPNAFGDTVVVIRDGYRVEGESTVDETISAGGGDEFLEFKGGDLVRVYFADDGFYFDVKGERP